jgi:TPR repeat protein
MYYYGKGVAMFKAVGLEKLQLAANAGDTFSQFHLASIYYYNLLREMKHKTKKKKFAFEPIERESMHFSSFFNLNSFVLSSHFLEIEAEHKIVNLLQLAAEKRHSGALSLLGQLYMTGFRSVEKNEKLAWQFLKQASNQGDVNATLKLAHLSLSQKGVIFEFDSSYLFMRYAFVFYILLYYFIISFY